MVFEETELKNGHRLITKLRNACQFVKIHLENSETEKTQSSIDLYPTDQWILARLDETVTKMTKSYANYEVGLAKIAFEEFFWRDFCDNYLELIKNRLYKPELYENGEQLKQSAQHTLRTCFWTILRLIAPIIPHVTEELYQDIFKQQFGLASLHLASMPESEHLNNIDIEPIMTIISDVRGYKTSNKLSL